ncbi:SDR family oxidoreductase [Arthrobacter sp. 135MFCol5.1]|uniref:SDR family oxidoreductase n=1 Tax=Arthrobacter sp. 135MFCol5.1 TaxID=1158050 RepID=UPI0003810734|nr:SDR family oxidoreductase [Arthrobacter sp. 135MFCol5.1]
MFYQDLKGRTAVVTGAASGIGAATARLLAANGARVALLARRKDHVETIMRKIVAEGGTAIAIPTDVTQPAEIAAAAEQIHNTYGVVDLVVNNAGVMLVNPFDRGRSDEWQRMIDTNFVGVLNVTQAFTEDLLTGASAGKVADLVNISSLAAHTPFPNYAVYGATKAAVTALSHSLRTELGPWDVRVTNIEPGATDTELPTHISSEEMRGQVDGMLATLGSLAPAEIADLIGYVTSRPRHINLRQVVVSPTRQA